MIQAALETKLKKIFQFKKVTFDQPSESREQECLFVEVETSRARYKEKRVIAKVSGKARVFAQNSKLPLGFFAQKIAEADALETADIAFFDIEENSNTYQNLVERTFSFIYFFNSQYDPDVGSIDSITFSEGN